LKNIKSHFKFNKQERSGIFYLLLLIILVQIGYFIFHSNSNENSTASFSLDAASQSQIDALKLKALKADAVKIFPFNPNFINDYKGYALGMSVAEIGRLLAFREADKYVNSAEEFQKVTLISDSLLKVISPYFKFPDWTQKSKQYSVGTNKKSHYKSSPPSKGLRKHFSEKVEIKDLNTATAEELKKISGIGEVLSARIVKFRNRLGGFLIDDQLYDVYNLEPEVVKMILTKFKVFKKPVHEKININTSSAYKISSLVYIKYDVAKNIISYRLKNGPFSNLNELKNIPDFPAEKIDRIALYLFL